MARNKHCFVSRLWHEESLNQLISIIRHKCMFRLQMRQRNRAGGHNPEQCSAIIKNEHGIYAHN